MPKVVSLAEEKDKRATGGWASGEARCMSCQSKWTASGPTDVYLECPECGLQRGLFALPFCFQDYGHWTCNCENDLFHITEKGAYCPNCGVWQNW